MLVDRILEDIPQPARCAISEITFEALRAAGHFLIWGTGRAARHAIENCARRNLTPDCVCDSFPHAEGDTFEGFPLFSSEAAFSRYPQCTALISCAVEFGIADILKAKGIPYYEWDTAFMLDSFSGKPLDVLMRENKEKIETVYRLLADEKSRLTFENEFRYRLTLDLNYIRSVLDTHVYFDNDVISKVDCGAFVDCGAYFGDTLDDFIRSPSCRCKRYYALEPDPESFKRLSAYVKSKHLENDFVRLLPVAAWEDKTVVMFNGVGNGGSCVTESGNVTVQADSIDNIVSGELEVGYIKMDVEGGEIQALHGAKKTIQENHPILGISIYHHKQDLWEIPLLIHEMNPSYKLYIRHHFLNIGDSVCYAIDKS